MIPLYIGESRMRNLIEDKIPLYIREIFFSLLNFFPPVKVPYDAKEIPWLQRHFNSVLDGGSYFHTQKKNTEDQEQFERPLTRCELVLSSGPSIGFALDCMTYHQKLFYGVAYNTGMFQLLLMVSGITGNFRDAHRIILEAGPCLSNIS